MRCTSPASRFHGGALPVVVLLHPVIDLTQTKQRWAEEIGFRQLADEHEILLVMPIEKSIDSPWGNVTADRVHRAVEAAAAELCVDLSRVFVVGHAESGRLAHLMACSPPRDRDRLECSPPRSKRRTVYDEQTPCS